MCRSARKRNAETSITEGAVTGVTAGYTFKWFVGTDTTTALALANVAGVKGDSAINLASGFYTVKVTDNLNPGASCLNTKTYEVIEDNAILSVANADVTITKQTDCSPTNGSITVNSVREDGIPVAVDNSIPNYTFVWTTSTGTVLTSGGVANFVTTNARIKSFSRKLPSCDHK